MPSEYKKLVFKILGNYKKGILLKKLELGYEEMMLKFNEEKIVKKTIEIYNKLLKKNNSSYLVKEGNSNESFWLAQ